MFFESVPEILLLENMLKISLSLVIITNLSENNMRTCYSNEKENKDVDKLVANTNYV